MEICMSISQLLAPAAHQWPQTWRWSETYSVLCLIRTPCWSFLYSYSTFHHYEPVCFHSLASVINWPFVACSASSSCEKAKYIDNYIIECISVIFTSHRVFRLYSSQLVLSSLSALVPLLFRSSYAVSLKRWEQDPFSILPTRTRFVNVSITRGIWWAERNQTVAFEQRHNERSSQDFFYRLFKSFYLFVGCILSLLKTHAFGFEQRSISSPFSIYNRKILLDSRYWRAENVEWTKT